MEECLRKKNDELDLFFSVTPGLLCIANEDGYFIRLNAAWEKTLGYTVGQLMGKPYIDLVHPDDKGATREAMSGLRAGREVRGFVNRYRCADGTYRWMEWDSVPVGNVRYAAAREITERKSAEQELKERLKFETLLADISARFVNIPAGRVDEEILDAERRICELLDLDVAGFWQWSNEIPGSFTLTHLYGSVQGTVPDHVDASQYYPWYLEEMLAGRVVAFSTLDELPAEAARDREVSRQFGVKSNLTVPLSVGGEPPIGVFSIGTTKAERDWPESLVKRIQLMAQIFVNALARKRADQALQESQTMLASVVSASPVGIAFSKSDRTVRWMNEAMTDITGYTSDELTGQSSRMLYETEEEFLRVGEMTCRRPEGGWALKTKWVSKNGFVRDVEVRAARVDMKHIPDGIVLVADDVTERLAAETSSAEAQSTIKALFESTQDMIWTVDPRRFGLMTFNSALERYFRLGIGLEIAHGMSPNDLVKGVFTPEVAEEWKQLYRRTLEEGPYTMEYLVSAGTKILLLSFDLLKRDGAVFGISVFGKDITEAKETQMEINNMRMEQLRSERMSALGELLASLTHELNQPLAAILSSTQAVLRFLQSGSPDMNMIRTILQNVVKDDKRAAGVINSLRSLVKKEQREKESVAINDMLTEVLSLVRSEAILRNVKIATDLGIALPPVHGDRIQLQQVVLNLTRNAFEAMDTMPNSQKGIMIRTQLTNGFVQVSVRDSGPGVDPGKLNEIWEPFFTTKTTGLGMGLRLSRSIVEAHGGHIWAENNPDDGGATFAFELPPDSNEKAMQGSLSHPEPTGGR